jgi:hypothetical protein
MEDCLQAASDILFELSGQRWAGSCQDVVRPYPRSLTRDHGRPIYPLWPFGYFTGGLQGFNAAMIYSGVNTEERGGPATAPVYEVTLGVYPVSSVQSMTIDGVTVDPSTYRVDDNRWLVRLADPKTGQNPGWPAYQRMDLDSSQPLTWEVVVNYGQMPPRSGVRACAEIACELALALTPSMVGKCRLPQRVTQITRQGVTAIVLDPWAFLDKGRTGLYLTDLFLSSVNPHNLRRRASVMSPDLHRRVRRAGAN